MSEYKARICEKIEKAFTPQDLSLIDDSHKHAGHAGADPVGETHFALKIVSEEFEGMSRIERHQAVYKILEDELRERVHALQLKTLTPRESASGR